MTANDIQTFDSLLAGVDPATILVCIRARMGTYLLSKTTPEDVWQETLLQAWKSRSSLSSMAHRDFRSWLLVIARNRICDLSDRESALKRGGATGPTASLPDSILASTTPSRILSYRERADTMWRALASVPEEHRSVVQLKLFEEASLGEISSELGLSYAQVKYRLRCGAEIYRDQLERDGLDGP